MFTPKLCFRHGGINPYDGDISYLFSERGKADKPKRYAMVHDETACIGCTACMDACRETNHVPEGVSRLEILRSEPTANSQIKNTSFSVNLANTVQTPPCVAVCPTGASFIDPETGIVDVTKDLCVGCQYCIAVCPYRVRFIHPEHLTADKCNFCRDTNLAAGKQPACVEACPTKALTFGDMNDPSSAVSRKVKENPVYRTKVELGTQPNLYHIPFQHGGAKKMTLDYPVPFHTPNLVWDSTIAIYLFLLGISSGAVQLAIAYKRSHKLENPSKKLDYPSSRRF